MKPGAVSSILFALTGIAVAVLSGTMMGPGFWSMAIIGVSVLVALSPYIPALLQLAAGLAVFSAVLSFLAVALGLLAATTGGSFRLPADQGLLLFSFFLLAVFGLIFARAAKPPSADA